MSLTLISKIVFVATLVVSFSSEGLGDVIVPANLTITGTGFLSGALVTVGGVSATSITVVSATSITARTPATLTPGTVDVKLADGNTRRLTAKNIIIATGSDVAPIPGVTVDEKQIVSSTGALSLAAVPKKLLVVGAGASGIALGANLVKLGIPFVITEAMLEVGKLGRIGHIDLGEQEPVGHGRLLDGLLVIVERAGAVHAVDRRDHPVEAVARGQQRIGHQRVQDRRRVGEAGGLDHHALERRDLAARGRHRLVAHHGLG